MGSSDKVKDSTERLTKKIQDGKANTTITGTEIGAKMAQGAVIGAAVALTLSSITNYIKYKNGEITEDEAFRDIGEDTVKGLITGGAMAGISLFLPGGPIGFIAGIAIGMYINTVCTNVLDEIFGKGLYEQILHASGYITGVAKNAVEYMEELGENVRMTEQHNQKSSLTLQEIQRKRSVIEDKKEKSKKLSEEL